MKSAILGLGIIGAQWAKHLHSDGVLAACWNRTPAPNLPLFETEISKIPAKAEILQICVADPQAVGSVLTAIEPELTSKHLVIQSSTIDPSSAQEFEKVVQAKGARYLEAPFTGSLPAAEKRELIFYAGGSPAVLAEAELHLKRLSKKIVSLPDAVQATTLKLVMNLQIASVMEAMAEALSIARQAGISDDNFFEAFKNNASYSGVAALKEPKLRQADFSPQFSTKHMAKDLRLLLKASALEYSPFLFALQEIFRLAHERGLADRDFSSIISLNDIR